MTKSTLLQKVTKQLSIPHKNPLNRQRSIKPPIPTSKYEQDQALASLTLESLSSNHRQEIIKYAGDERVSKSCDLPHPFTDKDADQLIDKSINEEEGQTRADYAILYGGSFAGIIGLGSIDEEQRTAWLTYWVAYPFWRRGIATAAVEQILTIASHQLNLQRIYTGVWKKNERSKNILLKQGFAVAQIHYQAKDYHERFNQETVLEMTWHAPKPL